MIKKKSGFWTLIFSFMPGAAEMYMGFMKMGVSLMGIFMALIAVGSLIELGPMLFFAFVAWFYGFFHARNLAALDEMELQQVEDHYLFVNGDLDANVIGKKYKKLIAGILILLGVCVLWDNLFSMVRDLVPMEYLDVVMDVGYTLPKLVIAVIVIIIGVKMIIGKKEELDHDEQ